MFGPVESSGRPVVGSTSPSVMFKLVTKALGKPPPGPSGELLRFSGLLAPLAKLAASGKRVQWVTPLPPESLSPALTVR